MVKNIIDPTTNVKDHIKQAVSRQDDLRNVDHRALRREIKLEIKNLRREHKVFKQHLHDLSIAETNRIDAIRQVDVGNVAVANTAAENRASTLAGQVNAAKDAQGVALKAETDPIRKDISDLRQSQWTIAGGTTQEGETRAKSANWGVWVGIAAAILFGLGTIFFNTIMIAITLYLGFKK